VIIGKLIPAATGLKRYRRIEIEPAEPLPRAIDDVGLLDQDEIAAELGLAGDGFSGGYGQEFDADLASLENIGAGGTDPGFAEELAELEIPDENLAVDED
jgi:DNA-directed RNA polymerase subunit beta'